MVTWICFIAPPALSEPNRNPFEQLALSDNQNGEAKWTDVQIQTTQQETKCHIINQTIGRNGLRRSLKPNNISSKTVLV